MITQEQQTEPGYLLVNWLHLNTGDAFEGEYRDFRGTFLKIPSGLLFLGPVLRNWLHTTDYSKDENIAKVRRMVNITYTNHSVNG